MHADVLIGTKSSHFWLLPAIRELAPLVERNHLQVSEECWLLSSHQNLDPTPALFTETPSTQLFPNTFSTPDFNLLVSSCSREQRTQKKENSTKQLPFPIWVLPRPGLDCPKVQIAQGGSIGSVASKSKSSFQKSKFAQRI